MHTIYHDLWIDASPNAVYDAVSLPEHLVNWWPQKCSGVPQLGETYNFYFTPEYDWYGEVTRSEKDRAFHVKMTKSDEDWEATAFGYDLEPLEAGVQVKFWHKDWPACNHHFRQSSYCWAILLSGLKNYVEKGVIVPFEARE